MSNTMQIEVTLHLKDEDRARIDKLLTVLENCVGITKLEPIEAENAVQEIDITERAAMAAEGLKDVLRAATAADALKDVLRAATPIENTPEPEKPKDEAQAKPQQAPEPAPKQQTVTLEQIRQKVVALTAAGGDKKIKAREIIQVYAPKISALPEDKLPEIWAKLTALD